MKLLFDHNLSHKLVAHLAELFPGSEHVRNVGLDRAHDTVVWEYARVNDLVIASKDEDFHQLSFLHGPPPKVVWIRLGNCTTSDVENVLRNSKVDLAEFDADETGAFVIVGGTVT